MIHSESQSSYHDSQTTATNFLLLFSISKKFTLTTVVKVISKAKASEYTKPLKIDLGPLLNDETSVMCVIRIRSICIMELVPMSMKTIMSRTSFGAWIINYEILDEYGSRWTFNRKFAKCQQVNQLTTATVHHLQVDAPCDHRKQFALHTML